MAATIGGFFLPGPCTDPGYENVRDRPHHADAREFIDLLWSRYVPLADTHFREDARNHFLERFWEMYLAVTLTERGLHLIRTGGEGPEFYFQNEERRIWVEAVAPGPGIGPDRVPDFEFGAVSTVPTEKILLRFTNALVEKRAKYVEAMNKGLVSTGDGYLLAINSRGIRHAPYGNTMPYFVQAFLPFGPLAVAIDPKTGNVLESFYQYRPQVAKLSGAAVSTKVFLEPEFAFCSAVIHSGVDCVNRPNEMGGDFCILHNPNSAGSIGQDLFSWARQLVLHGNELVDSRA